MSSYGYESHVLMIFNQLTSYVEDILKSYNLNEILLVATFINFYSLCLLTEKKLFFNLVSTVQNSMGETRSKRHLYICILLSMVA